MGLFPPDPAGHRQAAGQGAPPSGDSRGRGKGMELLHLTGDFFKGKIYN